MESLNQINMKSKKSNNMLTLQQLIQTHSNKNIRIFVTVGLLASSAYYINELIIAHFNTSSNNKNVLYIPDAPLEINTFDLSQISYDSTNKYKLYRCVDINNNIINTNIIEYDKDNINNLQYILINFNDKSVPSIKKVMNNINVTYIYVFPSNIKYLLYNRINIIAKCFINLKFNNAKFYNSKYNNIINLQSELKKTLNNPKDYILNKNKNNYYNNLVNMFKFITNISSYDYLLKSNSNNNKYLQLISSLSITTELIENYNDTISYLKTSFNNNDCLIYHEYYFSDDMLISLFKSLNIIYNSNIANHIVITSLIYGFSYTVSTNFVENDTHYYYLYINYILSNNKESTDDKINKIIAIVYNLFNNTKNKQNGIELKKLNIRNKSSIKSKRNGTEFNNSYNLRTKQPTLY